MYRSEEDYLKSIYELSIEQGKEQIKTVELSEVLGHSDQSINEKIKKLVTKDYVVFEPYKGVSLTQKGKKEAIRMVRAHRIWEVFLMEELGFSWQDIHRNAEELEHASSVEVIEKLYDYLGRPAYCHHGNPIPDLEGKLPPLATRKLSDMEIGETFVIKRVLDQRELLLYLMGLKLGIDSQLEIIDKNDFAKEMKVRVNDKDLSVTYPVAQRLFTFEAIE